MKKASLCIMFFTYSIMMLKPVIPYISDAVAHLFWYSRHMATVHYVNGKFHVHKAIMEEQKNSAGEKNPYSQKKDQSVNEYLVVQVQLESFKTFLNNKIFNKFSYSLLSAELNCDYPPPKA